MIRNTNELLEAIRDKGINEIDEFNNIKHAPTIGDMYEGLTKKIAEEAIFEGMDLRVVSGFITNDEGEMSKQIDCMIVIGEGKKIPNTDAFIYKCGQVIMVIEVKKNLHSKELGEGYKNLLSVYSVTKPEHDLKMNLIEDAFKAITGKTAPDYSNLDSYSYEDQMIFHALVVEALLPIRVIFGFEGFKTEISLREKYIEYLSENNIASDEASSRDENKKGFGATSLPNLIISGKNSIIKTNGMPYAIVFNVHDEFCWIASYRRTPLVLFLELLWTRLTYYYDVPIDVFGSSLTIEGLAPLLTARSTENCWEYKVIPCNKEQINALDNDRLWEPSVLNDEEFVLMQHLCNDIIVNIDDLNNLSKGKAKEILEHLQNERLVYIDDKNVIQLLTKSCVCGIDPELGYVAGENNDGRFFEWLSRRNR